MKLEELEVFGTSTVDLGTLARMTGLSFHQVQDAIEEAVERGYLLSGPLPNQWILTAPLGWRERRNG